MRNYLDQIETSGDGLWSNAKKCVMDFGQTQKSV
jgi:hypothetical protein